MKLFLLAIAGLALGNAAKACSGRSDCPSNTGTASGDRYLYGCNGGFCEETFCSYEGNNGWNCDDATTDCCDAAAAIPTTGPGVSLESIRRMQCARCGECETCEPTMDVDRWTCEPIPVQCNGNAECPLAATVTPTVPPTVTPTVTPTQAVPPTPVVANETDPTIGPGPLPRRLLQNIGDDICTPCGQCAVVTEGPCLCEEIQAGNSLAWFLSYGQICLTDRCWDSATNQLLVVDDNGNLVPTATPEPEISGTTRTQVEVGLSGLALLAARLH